ncbi:hypothetical protein BH10ACI4_BH10ACI4_30320 [soil metagenome]
MPLNLQFSNLQQTLSQQQSRWVAAITPLTQLAEDQKLLRLGATPIDGPSLQVRETSALEQFKAWQLQASAVAVPTAAAAATTGVRVALDPNLVRNFPHTLFAAIDWRNVGGKNFVSPVRDQAACGSCVAFGVIATVESRWRIIANQPTSPIDLSEAHLFYCLARSEGRMCSGPNGGWWPDRALNKFASPGVTEESCYPYTAGDQNCTHLCGNWAQRATFVDGWHSITNVAQMKAWLTSNGPLATCFTVYDDFFSYSSGVYHHVSGDVAGGHCVCVVGFDDGQQCWICKNSWGPGWGDHGFVRIGYGQCGIDHEMFAVEGVSSYKTVVPEEAIGTPVLANLNDANVVLAWTGTDSSHHLNIASSRGGWGAFGGKVILGDTSFDGPGLATGAGKVFIAWTGTDSAHHLNVMSSTDCVHFVNKVTLGDTSRFGPSLAFAFNRLFIAWVGTDPGRSLNVMSSADGITWANKVVLQESSDSAVSLSFANGKLYLVWQGTDSGSHLNVLESTDGTHFGNKVTLGDSSDFHASLVQSPNGLILAWTGRDSNHHLNVLHSSGSSSAFGNKITMVDTAVNGMGSVFFQGKVLVSWAGTDSVHHINVMQVI